MQYPLQGGYFKRGSAVSTQKAQLCMYDNGNLCVIREFDPIMTQIEDMLTILFERTIINYSSAAALSKKKLTVNDY